MGRAGTELTKFEWDMLCEYFKKRDIEYADVKYQYRVGSGAMGLEGVTSKLRRAIIRSICLKIDCVAKRNDGVVEIIEVKRVANAGAVGQLLAYKFHYELEYSVKVELILLCCFISNDLKDVCDKYEIAVVIIDGGLSV